jgi:hypothetical protein
MPPGTLDAATGGTRVHCWDERASLHGQRKSPLLAKDAKSGPSCNLKRELHAEQSSVAVSWRYTWSKGIQKYTGRCLGAAWMLAFCLFSIPQKGQKHTLARHGQPEYSVDALDHALLRRSCRNEAGGGSVKDGSVEHRWTLGWIMPRRALPPGVP